MEILSKERESGGAGLSPIAPLQTGAVHPCISLSILCRWAFQVLLLLPLTFRIVQLYQKKNKKNSNNQMQPRDEGTMVIFSVNTTFKNFSEQVIQLYLLHFMEVFRISRIPKQEEYQVSEPLQKPSKEQTVILFFPRCELQPQVHIIC